MLENLFEASDVHYQSIFFRIVLLFSRQLSSFGQLISDRLAKIEKEPKTAYIPLWPEEMQFDTIRPAFVASRPASRPASRSLLSQWMMKVANEIGK